nr:hypothetical protein [uncultured Roseococcus sp.]
MQTSSHNRLASTRPVAAAALPAAAGLPALPSNGPDPRKLREKVIFALIGTNSTGGTVGRAPALIADAEQIINFVLTGEAPASVDAA